MKPTFFKGAVVGGIAGAMCAAATVAVAGTGINGIFNLGVDNTVDAQTLLRGNTGNPQLRVNNQQGSDGAVGVLGIHSGAAGGAAGVQGESSSTAATATGVFGRVTSSNAAVGSAAVRGINNGNGFGVYGRNPNDVPFGYAVFGEGRYGVVGSALFSGASSGVYGSAPTGFAGVEGHTGNPNGYGVYGRNTGTGTSSTGAGVYGIHSSGVGTGPGILGETNSADGNATGILARANATNPGRDAVALRAINKSTNNYGMGVWGSIAGAGWGVLGEAGANGIGVIGKLGGAGTGVYGLAGPNGVGVRGVGGKTGVYGQATDNTGFAFAANGNAGQSRTGGGWVKAMALIDWHQPAGQQVVRCYSSQVAPGTPSCGITANGLAVGNWRIDFGFDVSDRFLMVTAWSASRGDWNGVVANAAPAGGSLVDVTLAYNGGDLTNTLFYVVVL
jgi:hypothetical protein